MRRWVCLALALLLAASPAAARDEGTFGIVLRGIKAGELKFAGRVENGRYSASGLLRSTGLLAFVREVSYEAQSQGRVRDGRFIPTRYTENADTGSRQSRAVMSFRNGVPQVKSYEPAREPRPEDVDPATQAGALDPMTAIYAVLRDVPRDEACKLNVRMFDGRRASRVGMTPRSASAERIVCDGAYVRVAGFSPEDMAERTRFPFSLTYAPAGGGLWRVVEMEFQTLYGRARLLRQ